MNGRFPVDGSSCVNSNRVSRAYGHTPRRRQAIVATGLALAVAVFAPQASAQVSKQKIDEAVKKGSDYLLKIANNNSKNGTPGLAAYALIKSGQSPDHPAIAAILGQLVAKTEGGRYTPDAHQFYEAGVDIMALEAAMHESGDKQRYMKEIEVIVQYILDGQAQAGSWFYPNQKDTGGDTSITQYAILGLWAASRAGVKIPANVWDRNADWHIKTQSVQGSFTYHPGGGGGVTSRHSMTVNGVASLCIARLHLFPKGDYTLPPPSELFGVPNSEEKNQGKFKKKEEETEAPLKKEPTSERQNKRIEPASGGAANSDEAAADGSSSKKEENKKRKRRFGVLDYVDVGTGKRVEEQALQAQSSKTAPVRSHTSLAELNQAISKGVFWLTNQFAIRGADGWPIYYLYGLERASALAGVTKYDSHDWYNEGATFLLEVQRDNGAFPGHWSDIEGTSFALLFLTNATRSLFTPDGKPRIPIGGGLLIGNRGLPENLKEVNMTAEGAQARKLVGPIDELLAELENPKGLNVEAAQVAIVEKVQLGDREALVGQRQRLLRLVEDPRVEVRRTVIWALGRCSQIVDAPLFLHALEDSDISVVVEANNALCWLSRRPNGVGLANDPLEQTDEGATEEQKLAATAKWREQLRIKWREWFASVQPYSDRELIPAPRPQ